MNSRKILFHLNCLEQGGAERVVSTLANTFVARGDEIVIATEWIGKDEYELDSEVRRILVGPKPEDEGKPRLIKAYLRIRYLYQCIREERPDVAIAFGRSANYRILNACRRLHIPVILAVRCNPVGNYDKLRDRVARLLLLPRADGAVFQTEGQRDFFPKRLRAKSEIILNPLNKKYIGIERPEVIDKAVVCSGRIVECKNHEMLIRAFLEVHRRHPEYSLRIYGQDSYDGTWEKLVSIITDYQAEDYIRLCGGSSQLDIDLACAEIFAFSSDEEGLPNSLIEAMAMGLPVVSTDCPCGGPRTIITHGANGMLIPVGDTAAMAEAICYLIEHSDEAKAMGDNARAIIDSTMPDTIAEKWRDYIEVILRK